MPSYARKRDANEPQIVRDLESAGCTVYRHLPCDLLVHHPMFDRPRLLEVKVPTAKGKPKLDSRQEEQDRFCQETGTPYVTCTDEAMRALGLLS